MAISKLILNDEVQMDVTSNTNTANNMLSGVIGTKNDGTSVTGNIATKTSSDLTVSGATVTAPAGYYANAASKAVVTTTHPNPTASITSSTGVVTASHTQTAGYVTAGTTTGTLSLTTQAGKTVTPTESAQTAVASYRWTTGNVNVAAISSTYVGTGVTTRSAADLTANGSIVTTPAGYYSTAATKTVAAGSAFPPAITITKAPTFSMNSTTGVVTASYTGSSSITPTVTSGYITAGTAGTISTTGTSTYQLASTAAATYYPSTADQTISSYRWLTGTQTIKSVITSNLTAANIASGVVVTVGDATNASRISQVTGTYAPGKTYTATITGTGGAYLFVRYPGNSGTSYNTEGDTFNIEAGETIYLRAEGSHGGGRIYVNNVLVANGGFNTATYSYEVPSNTNVEILLSYDTEGYIYVTEHIDEIQITENGIYNVSEYDFADVNVSGGGGSSDAEDGIIQRTISGTYENSRVTKIGKHAFMNCSTLTTASFPKATRIGSYAFASCYSLTIANFPSVTTLGTYAFSECSTLTTASFPNATTIGNYAFASCYRLTTASFPSVLMIGSSAFTYCTRLTTASFPNATTIGSYAFASCYSLVSAIFLASSVATGANDMFTSTPIGGYTTSTGGVYGSIYVPASLVDSYKTATYWSAYADRITSYVE